MNSFYLKLQCCQLKIKDKCWQRCDVIKFTRLKDRQQRNIPEADGLNSGKILKESQKKCCLAPKKLMNGKAKPLSWSVCNILKNCINIKHVWYDDWSGWQVGFKLGHFRVSEFFLVSQTLKLDS